MVQLLTEDILRDLISVKQLADEIAYAIHVWVASKYQSELRTIEFATYPNRTSISLRNNCIVVVYHTSNLLVYRHPGGKFWAVDYDDPQMFEILELYISEATSDQYCQDNPYLDD